jgi:hypothetical protein
MVNLIPAKLIENSSLQIATECFNKMSEIEKYKIKLASSEAVQFLIKKDRIFDLNNLLIEIQTDQTGRSGDVRDILIKSFSPEMEIGVSAKNRHYAVKHSRLSESINFGRDWFGMDCSKEYFDKIQPIFTELRHLKTKAIKWRDIPNKKEIYYRPLLDAFKIEMTNLYLQDSLKLANGILKYLLGSHDFYKIIKENGAVTILSFNLYGNLNWGPKLPIPNKLIDISMKDNSETTLIMSFDKGWQISFRIHNASTIVEPSLKFDIEPVGFPSGLSRHVIEYS